MESFEILALDVSLRDDESALLCHHLGSDDNINVSGSTNRKTLTMRSAPIERPTLGLNRNGINPRRRIHQNDEIPSRLITWSNNEKG
jgi:hypothetical protein